MERVIAVDFDGTLCRNEYPAIGEARNDVIAKLKEKQAEGAKLILWTCRSGDDLDRAVRWCDEQGLAFDAVNDNLEESVAAFDNNCRKVWANEYWDDKSVIVEDGMLIYPANM